MIIPPWKMINESKKIPSYTNPLIFPLILLIIIKYFFYFKRSFATKIEIVNSQIVKSDKEKEKEQNIEPIRHILVSQESEEEVESDDEK